MANIATGWIRMFSAARSSEVAEFRAILDRHPALFSYGCAYDLSADGDDLVLHFTSKWTSDSVWDLLDEVIAESKLSPWLQSLKIFGAGREDGTRHYVKVKKNAGDRKLLRLYNK